MKRFLLIALFILCSSRTQAQILQVPSGQYSSIQSAINNANNYDTVIVLPGTYQENIDFLGKAVTVRSVDPNDADIVAATVIDGNEPNDPNYASVVTFGSGESEQSVLEGFTITGGTGSWVQIYWQYKGDLWNRCGGGVLCLSSSPVIRKNVFRDNLAGQGGGIYFYDHSSPVITGNTFIDNFAVKGHGFDDPDPDDPNVYDSGDGGAIVGFQYCDATIADNLIEHNHADFYGGGIHVRQWSNGLIKNNYIIGNDSKLGAGVHITYTSSPNVVDNIIENNIAGSLGGGGIYVYYQSEPLIERNTITRNTSSNGAGIGVYYDSAPTIRNNLIYKNNDGAGIRIVGSAPVIIHNTITANYNTGIDCQPNSSPVIENNIITSNGPGWGICVSNASSPVMRYNNLWDNGSGTCGPTIPDQTGINGNISVSSRFFDPNNDDYHLNYDSRCINAADPNCIVGDLNDLDGLPRLMGQFVDIGAYETLPVWNISTGDEYYNIQDAVDDANDANTIIVTLGAHTGSGNRDIEFLGKAITVQSIDPNDPDIIAATIIDCQGSDLDPHRGFHFRNQEGPNSVLAGLTMTNGGGRYDGGAIRCWSNSSPTIKNCIITNNLSGGRAGGIYCGNDSSPIISNCIITNNIATRGYGGAIACFYYCSPTITNCIITNNLAQGNGHHGGGIYCHEHSDAIVANCIVTANSAGHRGGGLYAYWSSPTFINCTVIGNTAEQGGGIGSFRESNPFVINCIVRDNISPYGDQLALINTSSIWPGTDIPTSMTVSFSNIQGGQAEVYVQEGCDLIWGNGNIDIDPNFVDTGYWNDANTPTDPNDDFFVSGNYHLLPASDCINAGDNTSLPSASTADIDGEQRIFDDIVDMGADEVVTNPFDLNDDGVIDYLELAVLTDEWLQNGAELQTDFNEDSFIDFADYAELAGQWLWKGRWYQ